VIVLPAWCADGAIEVFSASVEPRQASFSGVDLDIPRFNPSLGTLRSITIDARGRGDFMQAFENMGRRSGNVRIEQELDMILAVRGGRRLVRVEEEQEHSYFFSSFDQVVDFGGTSGGTHHYAVTAEAEREFRARSLLQEFTGAGAVDLVLSAQGESEEFVRGGMQRGLFFCDLISAGADIAVTYDYTPIPVPEAATWLTGGAALLIIGLSTARSLSSRRSLSRL
jgi:hypothetical protein